MQDSSITFDHYLDIFRRRRILMLLVSMILFLSTLIVAVMWPPTYRSTATILIVEQEVPSDLVRSTITSYADQQIERIKAQVMTRSGLWPIVEEYDLYKELRKRKTSTAALEEFISNISIEMSSADVVDRRTGRPTNATIAFTLSYEGSKAAITQKVTNELTTLFLNENLKNREQQVQQTTAFLKQETEKLEDSLKQFELSIANFKNQAKGSLPELFSMNMQLLSQVERELIEKSQQSQSQQERIVYLEGELARLSMNRPFLSVTNPEGSNIAEQLRSLRQQYASMASHLSQEHPDIMKLRGEIKALESQAGLSVDKKSVANDLKEEEKKLAILLERLEENHPDVVRARAAIQLLKNELNNHQDYPLGSSEDELVFDPAYVTVQTQLAAAKTTLAHLQVSKKALQKRAQEYAARIERTPEIEPVYQALLRNRDNAAQKFKEYRSRLLEAQVAEGLELERKGERFSLVDPPNLPEAPVRPNRMAIIFIGMVLSLGAGVGIAGLLESLDGAIHTTERLQQVTNVSTICVIPYLSTPDERRIRARRRSLLGIGAMVLTLSVLVFVHTFWLPLDVIWHAALRKFHIG